MSNPLTFSLGQVVLTRFEVPEAFDFGTELDLVEHHFINSTGSATKIVQSQGAFPIPTSWKGTLYNSTALSRALQLDSLTQNQIELDFVYGQLAWTVLIKRFRATVHHQYEVDYEIELVVISEQNGTSNPGADNLAPLDLTTLQFYQQANSGYTAMVAADTALPSSVTSAYSTAQTTISGAYPFQLQTIETLLSVVAAVNSAISAIQSYLTPLQTTAVLEADLAKMNASTQTLNGLNLLARNLSYYAGSGFSTQTLTNFSGDLFSVAATYYPNSNPALVVPSIAAANNLYDFFVDSPISLSLPPLFNT